MQKCWSTTIFVLNLAVADLLYCVVVIPLTALQFYEKGWKWGKYGCILSGIFKYGIMTAEWMSVALIALTKCINLIFPQIGKQFFSGWNGLVFLMFFWIFTFLWYITPVYFLEVSFWKIMEELLNFCREHQNENEFLFSFLTKTLLIKSNICFVVWHIWVSL